MIEIPIILEDTEVKVAAFTDSIDLQVDIGTKGDRGTLIYSGAGSPAGKTQPPNPAADPVFQGVSEIRVNDFYIDVASTGYAWLWQYQPEPVGWTQVGKLNPPLYNKKHSVTFTAGASAVLSIPLVDIIGVASTTLDGTNFVVTVDAEVNSTTAYFINPKTVTKNEPNLDIVFTGRQVATTTIADASGAINLGVSIGVSA